MTHDELLALVGHDQRVAADLFLERILGRHLNPGTALTPAERYATDTALVEGQGHLVTSGSAAYLTHFEHELSHRISLETQALGGVPHAVAQLHLQGG